MRLMRLYWRSDSDYAIMAEVFKAIKLNFGSIHIQSCRPR